MLQHCLLLFFFPFFFLGQGNRGGSVALGEDVEDAELLAAEEGRGAPLLGGKDVEEQPRSVLA